VQPDTVAKRPWTTRSQTTMTLSQLFYESTGLRFRMSRLEAVHNQRLKLTGAAILAFRASTSLQAAPAA
jgi:hypothetical protein